MAYAFISHLTPDVKKIHKLPTYNHICEIGVFMVLPWIFLLIISIVVVVFVLLIFARLAILTSLDYDFLVAELNIGSGNVLL